MSDTSKATPRPWITDGLRISGPKDARSRHRNGRVLVGGVVDDLNDWRSWPAQEANEHAEFKAEREANADLIVAAVNSYEAHQRAAEALREIAQIGCMQREDEEEFFCNKDGSAHSCYCPAGIARAALAELDKAEGRS